MSLRHTTVRHKHATTSAYKHPSAYEVALRAGLIGPVKRAPRDLSTNIKHLKGFGF